MLSFVKSCVSISRKEGRLLTLDNPNSIPGDPYLQHLDISMHSFHYAHSAPKALNRGSYKRETTEQLLIMNSKSLVFH